VGLKAPLRQKKFDTNFFGSVWHFFHDFSLGAGKTTGLGMRLCFGVRIGKGLQISWGARGFIGALNTALLLVTLKSC